MGNTVSYRIMRFQLLNERRHHDIRVERCGADVVMQPLVSRYYTTAPIRPSRRQAPLAPHSTSARPPCRYRLFVIPKMKYGVSPDVALPRKIEKHKNERPPVGDPSCHAFFVGSADQLCEQGVEDDARLHRHGCRPQTLIRPSAKAHRLPNRRP
jgi:hypothetical protein